MKEVKKIDWDALSVRGILQAVIDPNDEGGGKNYLIDWIHWQAISHHIKAPGYLLDFGCGTGRYASRIVERGLNYAGVDTSPGMIKEAGRHNPGLASSFSVIGDDSMLPFLDGCFDYCLTTGVLQYLVNTPQFRTALGEFKRVLKPGGVLLIIEQVSRSQKASSTVSESATEADYLELIGQYFAAQRLERIRTCSFGKFASGLIGRAAAGGTMAKRFIPLAARIESLRARFASDAYLRSIPYYDILISATR